MSKDLLENDLATGTFKRSNVPCGANQVVGRGAVKAGNPKNVAEKRVIPSAERGTEREGLVEEQGTRIARSPEIFEKARMTLRKALCDQKRANLEHLLDTGEIREPFPHTTEWHPIHPLAVPDVMADVLSRENDTEVPPAL